MDRLETLSGQLYTGLRLGSRAGLTLPLVAVVVFTANAGLLVLQLLAGRFLAPFIGSSLETWTAIIGMFLLGIAVGNGVGGRLADRCPRPRRLALFLLGGSLAAIAMIGLPKLLLATELHRVLPLTARVPVLAFLECFPAGFMLSLITPLAVRLGLSDVRSAGRAAGRIFALGTLGCLLGNYWTGFVLTPNFGITSIALIVAAGLAALALLTLLIARRGADASNREPVAATAARPAALRMRNGIAIVFACSFCGMALELTASRILAEILGVSLYTWTGIIGVMLAGTACGNWLGGRLADRRGSPGMLAACLLAAALALLAVLPLYFALQRNPALFGLPLVSQIIAWTFLLFFLPMLLLGTISPQVIRLTASDVAHGGRNAGTIYAWSTAGAIAGTFAAGYLLISTLGMYRTVLLAAAIVALATTLIAQAWTYRSVRFTVVLTVALTISAMTVIGPGYSGITRESNYFAIRVQEPPNVPGALELRLDLLTHSIVKCDDPLFLFYPHEQIQLALFRHAEASRPANVLVIGGGGYTFPRAAKTVGREGSIVEVVEIDPGVTAVSYSHLGLDPKLGIRSHHLDGRQFLSELAPPGRYDLITLDAVNDLSVPWHLLTRECNDAAKRALAPGGVYAVTVIDNPEQGTLWRAAVSTLRHSFAHVETLSFQQPWLPGVAAVQLIYASDQPLDLVAILRGRTDSGGQPLILHRADAESVARLTAPGAAPILTDEFAPVDSMMISVFRNQK